MKHKILIVLALSIQTSQAQGEWPEFRGSTTQGHSTATNLPIEWSTTKNVIWKQAIPGFGWSSPIVSRNQGFLTTGIPDNNGGPSLHALCLDAKNGKILWDKEVFTPNETKTARIHDKNSQASPTPIIDGDKLYVHFGHHGTACLDRQGKILWRNNELSYEPVHGNGGSPIIVGGKLIFHADGASEPFITALDKNNGKVLWKVNRNTQAGSKFSFSTPLLITVNGQEQIISPHSGAVAAYDPKDGREIWRVRYGQGYSVVPRPVFGHGLLFVTTGFNRADLLAIRPDGQGDVTETHIAWRTTKGAPLTPSLLLIGEELYAVSDNGLASCWDAKTGKVHWQEKVEGNYSASPLAADGKIYLQNETGTGTILKQGQTFEKLATNSLEERTLASYAVAGNALFIRTERHLYNIAEKQ